MISTQLSSSLFCLYYRGHSVTARYSYGRGLRHRIKTRCKPWVQKNPNLHRVIYESPLMLLLIQLHEQELKMNLCCPDLLSKLIRMWKKTRIKKYSISFENKFWVLGVGTNFNLIRNCWDLCLFKGTQWGWNSPNQMAYK